MTRRLFVLALLGGVVALVPGCVLFRFLGYFFAPRQIEKAEYTFPADARIAVMIDAARPEFENPVFCRALYDKACDIFRDKKSSAKLLPPSDVHDLRRRHRDFDQWSVQRVGRELGATHVLYIKLDRLTLSNPDNATVVEPMVEMRSKVIAVSQPETDARVWPPEKDGRSATVTRQAEVAQDIRTADAAAIKLGRDAAHIVIGPFFDYDREEPTPVEP